MNSGMVGWPATGTAPLQRRISLPVTGITASVANSQAQFSTPWTVTINVLTGQAVLVKVMASLIFSTNYVGVGLWRVTGGPTFLASTHTEGSGQVQNVSFDWVDLTPGAGNITYEVYGASNATGSVTLRNDATSTFALTRGSSILIAETYYPPTS